MTFTLNVTPVFCERCGCNAQFNWDGVNVCGTGCYELLMIQRSKQDPVWVEFSIRKLLGDSVQGIQDTIGNAVKEGESLKVGSVTYSRYYPASQSWVIELNSYHRNNLVWLLNAIGYPYGKAIEPFNFANTGDWVGEIHNMLAKPDGEDPQARGNTTPEQLKSSIDSWLKSQK